MTWVEHHGHFIIYEVDWTPMAISSSMTWVEHHGYFIIHDMVKNSLFLSSQDSSWCQGKAISILSTSHVCNGSHTKARTVPGSSLSQYIYIYRQKWYFAANIKCLWPQSRGYLACTYVRRENPLQALLGNDTVQRSRVQLWRLTLLTDLVLQTWPCLGGREMSLSFLSFFEVIELKVHAQYGANTQLLLARIKEMLNNMASFP